LSMEDNDSSETSQASVGSRWDEDKFVWDKEDLDKINKLRTNKNAIPIVYKNDY